jgi:ABC-type Fe3+-citrate transport system substrate-binding protein
MVVGQNNYINDILHQLGMENVFEHLNSRYPEINEQQLENLNPNYILLSSEPYPFKERHKEIFRKICPNATIEIVDGEMFSWYGSRMLKAGDYLLNFQKKLICHSI